jgi:hypothetical protein
MAMVVSDTAQEASRVAGHRVQAAQHAADGMADLREKVQSLAENVLALSEQSQKTGEIITTVNDLADQSNLLCGDDCAMRAGSASRELGLDRRRSASTHEARRYRKRRRCIGGTSARNAHSARAPFPSASGPSVACR